MGLRELTADDQISQRPSRMMDSKFVEKQSFDVLEIGCIVTFFLFSLKSNIRADSFSHTSLFLSSWDYCIDFIHFQIISLA